MYSKALPAKISIKQCISVSEDCFKLANSADPDEMPPYVAFHRGLHPFPKYMFIGIKKSM